MEVQQGKNHGMALIKKKQRKLRAQNIVYLIIKTRQGKITKLGNTNQHKATQMILKVKD